MIDMNAALYLLKVISEYTSENVCVNNDIDIIKYELLFILAHIESYYSRFEFLIFADYDFNLIYKYQH